MSTARIEELKAKYQAVSCGDGWHPVDLDELTEAADALVSVLESENETLKRELADVRARMERKDAALRLWLAYDNLDEADFSQHGPMLLYAKAIEATRAALQEGTG